MQTTKSRSQTAVVRNIPKKYAYNINKTKQKNKTNENKKNIF